MTAILDRACASCGRRQPAMIEREGTRQCPGVWYLCGSCWGTPGEKPQPVTRRRR